MKNIRFYLSAAPSTLIPACFLQAQTIDLKGITTTGNKSMDGVGSLHWSVVETACNIASPKASKPENSRHKTITWHLASTRQSELSLYPDIRVSAFPDPGVDFLRIESSHPVRVQLFDSANKKSMMPVLIKKSKNLDLARLAGGDYFLQAQDLEGSPLRMLKITITKPG